MLTEESNSLGGVNFVTEVISIVIFNKTQAGQCGRQLGESAVNHVKSIGELRGFGELVMVPGQVGIDQPGRRHGAVVAYHPVARRVLLLAEHGGIFGIDHAECRVVGGSWIAKH